MKVCTFIEIAMIRKSVVHYKIKFYVQTEIANKIKLFFTNVFVDDLCRQKYGQSGL